jgi:hypothetical protein
MIDGDYEKFHDDYYVNGDGCWIWMRQYDRHGYPVIGQKKLLAHRYALKNVAGREVPKGWHVHHKCEVTACVNPSHLQALPPELHMSMPKTNLGENRKSVVLTDAQRAEMVELFKRGCSIYSLSAMFKVPRTTVRNVLNRSEAA